MNLVIPNCLGCPQCGGSCNEATPVQGIPGIPDVADIGKKAAGVAILLVFGFVIYKTFA